VADLRSILWPQNVSSEPTGVQRFGRVIHWCGAIALAIGVAVIPLSLEDPSSGLWALGPIIGGFWYLVARAGRYIFAGE
jgi:hypothetical protein